MSLFAQETLMYHSTLKSVSVWTVNYSLESLKIHKEEKYLASLHSFPTYEPGCFFSLLWLVHQKDTSYSLYSKTVLELLVHK